MAESILVIENAFGFRTELCLELTKKGYEAVGVATTAEGLEPTTERYNLVIWGLMPDEEDVDTLRRLRETHGNVILMTDGDKTPIGGCTPVPRDIAIIFNAVDYALHAGPR
jgi:DNA-binding response OmpR family regulator